MFRFAPDPDQARQLRRRIHVDLGDSLAHVCERASSEIAFDTETIGTLISRLREGRRHPPAAFGCYFDLVQAVLTDRRHQAEAIFAALATLEPAPREIRILPLDDPAIARHGDLYQRKMDTDPQDPFAMIAPAPQAAAAFAERIRDAIKLLEQAVPALAGEIGELISELVLAVPPSPRFTFDGGSPHMLWGAAILNIDAHPTRVDLAAAVAHEASHVLLFAMSTDEPLVSDPDNGRYLSPLRTDPRPIDGIYHATFVAARLNWLMRQLGGCDLLSPAEQGVAKAAAQAYASRFEAGDAMIAEHGRPSQTGRTILDIARAHMQAANII